MGRADFAPALLVVTSLLLSSLLSPVFAAEVVPGIGMSGSLPYLSPVIVPQGAAVSSDSFFIVVYNHADIALPVVLGYNTSHPGIRVGFEPNETTTTLQPHEARRYRVVVNVSSTTPPGNYSVYVYARVVLEKLPGKIVVTPGVSQRFVVRVVGEYAWIHVRVVDPSGRIAGNALVRLYRLHHGRQVSFMDTMGGVLDAKVVPGNYTLRAYIAGELVAEKKIQLHNHENKTIILEARIVYVERFTVNPVRVGEEIRAAKIHIVIKNVYKTLRGVSVVLLISRNGKIIEKRILVSSSTLPRGRTEYFFDYIPPQGFKPGNYTFQVAVKGFNKTLALSPIQWVYVPPKPNLLLYVVLGVLVAAGILVSLWYRRRKKRGR